MHVAKRALFAAAIFFQQAFLAGQAPPSLRFEVASVKPAQLPAGASSHAGGGPGTDDPEHVRFSNVPVSLLFMTAYGIKDFQLSGPGWLANQRYDVEAKVPAGATRDQLQGMLQGLLAERFRARIHRETRILSGYELSVAKRGAKLKAAEPPSAATAALIASGAKGRAVTTKDKDGLPELRSGVSGVLMANIPGGTRMSVRGKGIEPLVDQLEVSYLKMPVRDATGLDGKYDFDLTFSRPNAQNADTGDRPPDLFAALEEQLGLKLEAKNVPFNIVVVDSIEKTPTPN